MNKQIKGLYVITDHGLTTDDMLVQSVEQALIGGAQIVQYRDKRQDFENKRMLAKDLCQLCKDYQRIFIVNDSVELAHNVDAHGVHIGENDALYAHARQILGEQKIIGVSCYNQLRLAVHAQRIGADYVAFGSFFPSKTKPNARRASLTLLRSAKELLNIPVVAIGGITADNGGCLCQAGADALAVVQDVFSKTNIAEAARRYEKIFNLVAA